MVGAGGAVEVTRGVRGLVLAASVIAAAGVTALSATCNYGEVVVVQPAAAAHGPFHLVLVPDPEDSADARTLGWSGRIPGADVTISPANADTAVGPPVASLQTGGAGTTSVADLPDGDYLVEARRLLTAAEAVRLGPGDDIVGFMAYAVVRRGEDTVRVFASRRHSLVISEWSFNGIWNAAARTSYDLGGYLELANNSDTTIYLDGLVVGMGYAMEGAYASLSCADAESFSNDPEGIWTRHFDSLPGTGHTYPLAPGETAVIATDAIDHTVMQVGALDLSRADFEFVGLADADNPGVPNTISIGLSPDGSGHGLIMSGNAVVAFAALPLDVAALPRQRTRTTGNEYARVPRARILDVVALLSTLPFTPCPHLVHDNFDRHAARLVSGDVWDAPASVGRRVAYTRADGRKILQHTRAAAADFFRGPRSPGWLP